MRISDWSSDVCSSDLLAPLQGLLDHRAPDLLLLAALFRDVFDHLGDEVEGFLLAGLRAVGLRLGLALARAALALRLLLGVAFAVQVVVADELVAFGGTKIGVRVLSAAAGSGLVVFAPLSHHRPAAP